MALMSFANYYNKIWFIFALYDFDCSKSIDQDEISIMVICFIEGWSKLVKDIETFPWKYLEKVAEIIYSSAESVPDGKIAINEIGTWLEVNENFTKLLSDYEPELDVPEKSTTFLSIPRHQNHLPDLIEKYLGKKQLTEMSISPMKKWTASQQNKNQNFSTISIGSPLPNIKNM
jgi:hypothetical protein